MDNRTCCALLALVAEQFRKEHDFERAGRLKDLIDELGHEVEYRDGSPLLTER